MNYNKKKAIRSLPYFKQYMKENNLKNQDLADITGYSEATISNFANGRSGSRGLVNVLARELEVSIDLISQVVIIPCKTNKSMIECN